MKTNIMGLKKIIKAIKLYVYTMVYKDNVTIDKQAIKNRNIYEFILISCGTCFTLTVTNNEINKNLKETKLDTEDELNQDIW